MKFVPSTPVMRIGTSSPPPAAEIRELRWEELAGEPPDGFTIVPSDAAAERRDSRAALVRRLLTDQLDFISVAKKYVRVIEFGDVLDHVIPTTGNQGRLGGKAAGLVLMRVNYGGPGAGPGGEAGGC